MLDLVPELCDRYPELLQVLPPIFYQYGTKHSFYGAAETVRCWEDNSLVRECLNHAGKERVLVIDGGGMPRRALLGDQLAKLAIANGWAGIVVFGYIRDVDAISSLPIGVAALGATPMKTDKKGMGEHNVSLHIHGCHIHPDNWVYADRNGIIISQQPLPNLAEIIASAE